MHSRRLNLLCNAVASLALGLVACANPEDPAAHSDGSTDVDDDESTDGDSDDGSTSADDTGETDDGESDEDSTDTGQDTDDPPMLCDGDPCEVFDDCCDGQSCIDGTCQAQTCVEEDSACDEELPCCGDFACDEESGTCQLPAWCVGEGETCDAFFVPCCEPFVCNTDGFIDECKMP